MNRAWGVAIGLTGALACALATGCSSPASTKEAANVRSTASVTTAPASTTTTTAPATTTTAPLTALPWFQSHQADFRNLSTIISTTIGTLNHTDSTTALSNETALSNAIATLRTDLPTGTSADAAIQAALTQVANGGMDCQTVNTDMSEGNSAGLALISPCVGGLEDGQIAIHQALERVGVPESDFS